MAECILTQEYLNSIFEYKNGVLYWKNVNSGEITKKAGWIDALGYWNIGINGKTYKSHRLIYLMHYGCLPDLIDHIDNDPLNNLIENLRAGTKLQNSWNQKIRITNTSGHKGISWNKKSKRWFARCMISGKSHFLGQFTELHKAVEVIKKFREENHGEFARHF